jgi:glycosyltransferase involved in cell wall biosynthesis
MIKLSAVITAFNEEKNLERCLKSLSFVDEIVVVDHSSLDKTSEIAQKYTNKVFFQKNDPKQIDLQKNFGFEKVSNEWILSIDADEEVTKELAEEIKHAIDIKNNINGYWIPRKNIIFGKWIRHSGWYPDPQLRLFKKNKGKFTKVHVHEHLTLEGESAFLKEHIIHHNYDTIGQFIGKMANYAPNEANNYIKKGYVFSYFDAIRFPLDEFLSRFFSRKGYKDGFLGLMLAILMAFYHFLVFASIWELNKFRDMEEDRVLSLTEQEFKKSFKNICYWLEREKLEMIKNPLKRIARKISNKFR